MNKKITLIIFCLIIFCALVYFTNSKSIPTNNVEIPSYETLPKTTSINDSIIQDIEQNTKKPIVTNFIELDSKEFAEKEFEIKIENSPYYPDSPLDAFIKHIEKAESGAVESQYIIYSVLKNCELGAKGVIKSVGMEFNHQRSNRLGQLIELYTDHCRELFEESEASIKQLGFWKKKLIENRHSFIHSEHHVYLKTFDNLKQKTGRDYLNGAVVEELSIHEILDAIDTGSTGKFKLMAHYLTEFKPYTHLNTEVQAWYLAECIKFGMCVTDNLLNEYKRHLSDKGFPRYQIDLIFSTAYKYMKLVENEEWFELSNSFN